MSRKRAAEPVSVPETVRVKNPGRQNITASGPHGSIAVRAGDVREVPAWVASHPAVTGARAVLVVVPPDEG